MESDLMLEDGEIDDSNDVEIYVPLERPSEELKTNVDPIVQFPSDQEASEESSSDSDSSNCGKTKAPTRPKKKKSSTSVIPPRRKKYDVWCQDISEEVLANNLVNCNVNRFVDRSRDVESYNHLLPLSHVAEVNTALRDGCDFSSTIQTKSNKRNHSGRYVASQRKNFKDAPTPRNSDVEAREIFPLTKTVNDTNEDLAQDIANKLFEEKEEIILQALNVAGKEIVMEVFEETRKTEMNGGLLIMNGRRRRTPGGVFLYILKSCPKLKPEQISDIFRNDRKMEVICKRKAMREVRKEKAAKRKEAMRKEDYSTLLSKTEAAIMKLKEEVNELEDAVEEGEVKNPPPSPATDGRDNSSDGEDAKLTVSEMCIDVLKSNLDI